MNGKLGSRRTPIYPRAWFSGTAKTEADAAAQAVADAQAVLAAAEASQQEANAAYVAAKAQVATDSQAAGLAYTAFLECVTK